MDARTWVEEILTAAGHSPLPDGQPPFTATGYTVSEGQQPGTAVVTVTARYTGQDKYEDWGTAWQLANRLMDELQRLGAGLEERAGQEPNCVFTVHPRARERIDP